MIYPTTELQMINALQGKWKRQDGICFKIKGNKVFIIKGMEGLSTQCYLGGEFSLTTTDNGQWILHELWVFGYSHSLITNLNTNNFSVIDHSGNYKSSGVSLFFERIT